MATAYNFIGRPLAWIRLLAATTTVWFARSATPFSLEQWGAFDSCLIRFFDSHSRKMMLQYSPPLSVHSARTKLLVSLRSNVTDSLKLSGVSDFCRRRYTCLHPLQSSVNKRKYLATVKDHVWIGPQKSEWMSWQIYIPLDLTMVEDFLCIFPYAQRWQMASEIPQSFGRDKMSA